MKWSECAKMCRKVFGSYIDWEDHEWECCPVCEVMWEDIE